GTFAEAGTLAALGKWYVYTPRPNVAATSRFGSPGLIWRLIVGVTGSPAPRTAQREPFVSEEMYAPASAPTISWFPRLTIAKTGMFGSVPEMSTNVSPASVERNTCPCPIFLFLSPKDPGG